MRALGPGSVSSFLKVILDVFRIMLWIAIGLDSLMMVGMLLLSFRPDILGSHIHLDELQIDGPWIGPLAAGALLIGDLYLAGGIVVVENLRRIFRTLIAGDPFDPLNARRLRLIGAALAVIELGRYAVAAAARVIFHGAIHVSGAVSLTTWFAVLVIFVLAEVFREGARLRGEAELTI